MDVQRLRNLTTGRLHTEIGHVYEDLGRIAGDDGIMTHMIPRVMRAGPDHTEADGSVFKLQFKPEE